MSVQIRLKMYKTMILPHIDYGDILYDVAGKFILDKIQVARKQGFKDVSRGWP